MKHRNVLVLSFSLAFLLLNFQNCAPAVGPHTEIGSDGEVRIVDDWSKAEIQFATAEVRIEEEENSAIVSGLCNRKYNQSQLRWALYAEDDNSGRAVKVGGSECRSGQFAFDVSNLDVLDCGVAHRLVVEGDWGGMAFTQFEKVCQSLQAGP